ncbi:MAG: alpha/beta fold hydrolase [Bacilli bacterium]
MDVQQHYVLGMERAFLRKGTGEKGTIVFLHGFLGRKETWTAHMQQVNEHWLCLAPDLYGHGDTVVLPEHSNPSTFEIEVERLHYFIAHQAIGPVYLIGYSMGARLAIALASTHSASYAGIMSVGGSFGLATEEERATRRQLTKKWARPLISGDLKRFVHFWESLDLFKTQRSLPIDVQENIRRMRLAQDASRIQRALYDLNVSEQPDYSTSFLHFNGKAMFVAGEYDSKYVDIAKRAPKGSFCIVPQVGHAVHVERPEFFDTIVNEFIE